MTNRERASLALIVFGVAALVVAACAFWGWRAGVTLVGALTLIAGVVLCFDDAPGALPLAREYDEPLP